MEKFALFLGPGKKQPSFLFQAKQKLDRILWGRSKIYPSSLNPPRPNSPHFEWTHIQGRREGLLSLEMVHPSSSHLWSIFSVIHYKISLQRSVFWFKYLCGTSWVASSFQKSSAKWRFAAVMIERKSCGTGEVQSGKEMAAAGRQMCSSCYATSSLCLLLHLILSRSLSCPMLIQEDIFAPFFPFCNFKRFQSIVLLVRGEPLSKAGKIWS